LHVVFGAFAGDLLEKNGEIRGVINAYGYGYFFDGAGSLLQQTGGLANP
jgi:hypothetical protein